MTIDELKVKAKELGFTAIETPKLLELINERNEIKQDISDFIAIAEYFLNETGIKEFSKKKAEKALKSNDADVSIGMGDLAAILPILNKIPKVLKNKEVQNTMTALFDKYGKKEMENALIEG